MAEQNFDMMSGNDYTPSARAKSAVSTAQGSGSGKMPDHADTGSVSAPSEADQPSDQHTGGKVVDNTQKGDTSFEQPDGGRGKVEKGSI